MGSFQRIIVKLAGNFFPPDPIVGGPEGINELGLGVQPMAGQTGAVIDEHDTDDAQSTQVQSNPGDNDPERWMKDIVGGNQNEGK